MKNTLRSLIILSLLLLCDQITASVAEDYQWFEDSFLSGRLSYEELLESADNFRADDSNDSQVIAAGLYILAGDYQVGYFKDREAGSLHYSEAAEVTRDLESGTSLGANFLIDAKIRNLIGGNIISFIKAGIELTNLMNSAIESYPDDPRTRFQLAMKTLNAPALFGGDIPKGQAMINEIIKDPETSTPLKFSIYQGMAFFWYQKKDLRKSDLYWEAAQRIYPDSWMLPPEDRLQ